MTMDIPLPNLDDRRWADLVDEGRALIPLYAPEWTDHNVHDPGITLIELFAWLAEMDIYRLNRIPDRHKRKFLSLVGIVPPPPKAARTVLAIVLKDGASHTSFPSATEFAGLDAFGEEIPFSTLEPLTIVPGQLQALQIRNSQGWHDVTERWSRGENFGIFGAVPKSGTEFYLGFTAPLPPGVPVSLFFTFAGVRTDEEERRHLIQERMQRRQACRPPLWDFPCDSKPAAGPEDVLAVPPHHGVRTVWEFAVSLGSWRVLDPNRSQIGDDTRAFTLDGPVIVTLPSPMAKQQLGRVGAELYYLRCRFDAGAYDTPPVLGTVAMNAVAAEQAVPVYSAWAVAKAVVAYGPEPLPGDITGLELGFNERGEISDLAFFKDEQHPAFRVLDYAPASTSSTGRLAIETGNLGISTGIPNQAFMAPRAPVQAAKMELYCQEQDGWHQWARRDGFEASGRSDRHFRLDAASGEVQFGDGEHGHVPPKGSVILATYRSIRAAAGNIGPNAITRPADSPHNRALIPHFDDVAARIADVANRIAAAGGKEAESLAHAIGRAIELRERVLRAVTLADYEKLAFETPGVRLARATARANLHPAFPCFSAPGLITLIILPDMPVPRPQPSPGLKLAVASYLQRRRVIGTRVEVVGPRYLEVAVQAQVKMLPGVSAGRVRQAIGNALNGFLDPLEGGPGGIGWPFGRDVYRSEILQVIDEVPGVDHVLSLSLIAEGCEPQCGNVCLGPTWLVAAGQHAIEVV